MAERNRAVVKSRGEILLSVFRTSPSTRRVNLEVNLAAIWLLREPNIACKLLSFKGIDEVKRLESHDRAPVNFTSLFTGFVI
jgi:hypothetical protein